jgi:hypothetical protein
MPVYSVMLQDDRLIKNLKGFKHIVIVGCGGCANDSLAFRGNLSQKAEFNSHEREYRPAPDAIQEEADRLKAKFQNTANDIRIIIAKGLCLSHAGDLPVEWIKLCYGSEAVLALCCTAGVRGIKQSLSKSVKVIPGMKTEGVLYVHRIYDPENGLILIDQKKSAAIPFSNKDTVCMEG